MNKTLKTNKPQEGSKWEKEPSYSLFILFVLVKSKLLTLSLQKFMPCFVIARFAKINRGNLIIKLLSQTNTNQRVFIAKEFSWRFPKD